MAEKPVESCGSQSLGVTSAEDEVGVESFDGSFDQWTGKSLDSLCPVQHIVDTAIETETAGRAGIGLLIPMRSPRAENGEATIRQRPGTGHDAGN